MPPRSTLALLLALGAAGCGPASETADAGPDAAPGCTLPFLGDRDAAPELEVIVLGAAPPATPLADGGTVPLIFPPQGGRVIFAGARAKNVDACGVVLTGALRDEQTSQVRFDARTINLLPASDGWGESDATDYSTFSNIPVCPNEWSKTDIYGTAYHLELTLAERGGRARTRTLEVTPTCAEPDRLAECLCICKGGYVLGEPCGGVDAGGGADAGAGE